MNGPIHLRNRNEAHGPIFVNIPNEEITISNYNRPAARPQKALKTDIYHICIALIKTLMGLLMSFGPSVA